MGELLREPSRAAPIEVAVFRKTRGTGGAAAVGDEFVVHMPGPWDGPVVVADRTPTSFRSPPSGATWRPGRSSSGPRPTATPVASKIESWARSGDRLSSLLFDRVKLAKEMQLHMWTHFCERAPSWPAAASAAASTSTPAGSRSRPPVAAERPRAGPGPRALAALAGDELQLRPRPGRALHDRERLEDRRLPPGAPARGARPPAPGGSFEVAQRLMRDYEFADPAIVQAVYAEDSPFETRDMLLEGRFYGLRFHFGVRVGGLVDEETAVDGRPVRRWGWNYRTLQGHLEMGQMDYEVRKWLDSGEVDFRIHAFSRPAHIPNPVIRLGFGCSAAGSSAPLRQARLPAHGPAHRRPDGNLLRRQARRRFPPKPLCRNDFGQPRVVASGVLRV